MRTIIACLMLSCAAFAGAPLSEPYTREVKVPAAGWYRVPVDGHIWRYARGRVLAFDENGKMLPCGILPVEVPSPASEEAQPRLVKVEEEGDKLVLYLQVDHLAGKHDRLILDFGGADLLEMATLWGSSDGHEWKTMAQGTLFRMGSGERMQGTALDYPASGFNQLKMVLPKGSGELKQAVREFRIGSIRLHYAPDETIPSWVDESVHFLHYGLNPDFAEALAGNNEKLVGLDLPLGCLSAMQFDLPLELPHAPLAVSLLKMDRGMPSWEYSCTLGTDARSFPIPGGRLCSPAFLKIGRDDSSIIGVSVRRPKEEVLFFMDHSGTLTLAYGGFEKRPENFPTIQRQPGIQEIMIGPVVTHSISLSPELARLAAKPTQPSKVQFRWNLNLPAGAAPGQWIAVELTPEIKSIARGAANGEWGIMSIGKLVPSFGKADPLPLLGKSEKVALIPDPASPGRSRGDMAWGNDVFPVIWLSFKAQDLGEPVSVQVAAFRDPKDYSDTPGEPPSTSWSPVGQTTIECGPWTTTGVAMMGYTGPTPEKVMITIEGRTLPPPRSIDVSVWRLCHRLVFPVPEGMEVHLISGMNVRDAGESLRPHLAMDRMPGTLPTAIVGALIEQGTKKRPWDRILFIAGLVLAVAVLLTLIVRLLPRRQEG